jgi:TRAP-type C4-dicarboxylate transport system permease small subunit
MAFMRIMERITHAVTPIGLGALAIMMVVVVINVVGRAFFRAPLYGAVELVQITGAILVSFIAAYTQSKRSNVIVSIVIDKLSPGVQRILYVFTMFLSLVTVAALVWAAFSVALEMTLTREETGVFQVAQYPYRIVWVFGLAVLLFLLLAQFIESIGKVLKK